MADQPQRSAMNTASIGHRFTVTVDGCTEEQAKQVMRERIYHDESYGFDYTIDFKPAAPRHELLTWCDEVAAAISEDGSNDDEHDLLVAAADEALSSLGYSFAYDEGTEDSGYVYRVVRDDS
jgi:hypothetical protein